MKVQTSKEHYRIASGVLVFIATLMVLVAPATATENKLLFVPQHSTAYGHCVDVDIYTDINETDNATATQFDIEYDPNCVQDFPSFDNTSSGWTVGPNASVTYSNPASGICRFTTLVGPPNPPMNPPISGHIYVGRLTICCNDTGCESFLNFTNALYVKGDLNSTSPLTDNGTFQCEAGICGDCDESPGVTTNDGWLIYMNKTFPGNLEYAFNNTWAADCDGSPGVTTNDGWLIYMNKTFPGNLDYVLQCN